MSPIRPSLCAYSCPPPLLPVPPPPPRCGSRPYGLEEDVRQYEQDLAKRLYQSRVRASQGTAPPPQSQNAAASSAASQLRSAQQSRPWPACHCGGIAAWGAAVGCFGWGSFIQLAFFLSLSLCFTLRLNRSLTFSRSSLGFNASFIILTYSVAVAVCVLRARLGSPSPGCCHAGLVLLYYSFNNKHFLH